MLWNQDQEVLTMKEYEVVHEIFNQCSGNQMRDVFIEEIVIADLEAYVASRHQDKDFTFEREDLADGTVIYHVNTFVVFFELLQKIVEIFRKNLPLPFNGCKINP